MKKLLLGIGAGLGIAYALRDRIRALVGGDSGTPTMSDFGAQGAPSIASAPDDAVLTDRVKSEIFRDADLSSGQVNVNTEFGKVVLRGEVESEDMVRQLVDAARNVQGVEDVESLLTVAGSEEGGDSA